MQRIHCPRHKEKTASVVVYEHFGWCYGGCGKIPLSELGDISHIQRTVHIPSDISSELVRIAALPRANVRGINLPVDGDSFYIVWPDGTYYKRRKFFPGEGPKYINPRGHKKPLFIAHNPKGATKCAIVEGEINSLSLSSINPPYAVCSPGGVSDFKEELLKQLNFKEYILILDKDKPGLEAALKFKQLLTKYTPYVTVVLLEKDCNQLLQEGILENEAKQWE